MIFRTCPSYLYINLFPDHSFFKKIKFVLSCSSASGMHHYFTVQLYTTWRHPGLSFVYETSLTVRWLEEEMMANCHLLTTTRRTDKGRGKNLPIVLSYLDCQIPSDLVTLPSNNFFQHRKYLNYLKFKAHRHIISDN